MKTICYTALNTGEYDFICLRRNTANAVLHFTGKVHVNSKEETKSGYKNHLIIIFLSVAMLKSYAKRPLKISWFDPGLFLAWTLHKNLFFSPIQFPNLKD